MNSFPTDCSKLVHLMQFFVCQLFHTMYVAIVLSLFVPHISRVEHKTMVTQTYF